MSQKGLAGSKFRYTAGTVAEETAPGSKEEEGKAEAEPYGRKSSISVVGAH